LPRHHRPPGDRNAWPAGTRAVLSPDPQRSRWAAQRAMAKPGVASSDAGRSPLDVLFGLTLQEIRAAGVEPTVHASFDGVGVPVPKKASRQRGAWSARATNNVKDVDNRSTGRRPAWTGRQKSPKVDWPIYRGFALISKRRTRRSDACARRHCE